VYASELRTYGLCAVVAVFLGAGGGVSWHYFADRASERVVVAAATPLAQQDASNPSLACPPPPRERLPVVSRNNLPDTAHATGALKVTRSADTGRARHMPHRDRPDDG
jgi:hypothetical protein